MKTLKGPGIFLAQFIGAEPPFDKLETMAAWVADLGYVGVQMPTGGADSFFDLALAAESQTYCDDIAGMLAGHGCGSPSCRPTCRASWSPCTRPMTSCSTASRRRSCAASRKSARPGRWGS
jgi:hypothetical protein